MADVGHTVGNNAIGIQFGMILHGPVGIERHAYHIELATILLYDVKVIIVEALQVSAIQMHDDDGTRKYLLYSIVTSTDKACILLGVLLDMPHRPK